MFEITASSVTELKLMSCKLQDLSAAEGGSVSVIKTGDVRTAASMWIIPVDK